VKFIEDDRRLHILTGKLFDSMDLQEKEGKSGEELKMIRDLWIQKWADDLREIYNNHRNYVQQQLVDRFKHAVLQGTHQEDFPCPDELRALCLRDKALFKGTNQERHKKLMVVFWKVMLPCVTGDKRWGPEKRNYQKLSEAKMRTFDPESAPCVTESDEAYLQVLYENNYKKWIHMYSPPPHGLGGDKKVIAEKKKANDPNMEVKWTNPRAGQVKFGGWLPAGKKAFKDLKAGIVKARKEAHVPDLKDAILQLVRQASDWDAIDQKRAASKNRKKDDSLLSGTLNDAMAEIPEDLDDWE